MNYVNEYCRFNDANKTLYFNNGLTIITAKMVPKSIRPDIENVVIPNTVQRIDNQVFSEYISLKAINIPDSVREIGESVFFDCVSLEKVSIGSGVQTIGDISFLRCPEIKRVEITDLSAWINIDFKTSFSVLSILMEFNKKRKKSIVYKIMALYIFANRNPDDKR